jgi:integrase
MAKDLPKHVRRRRANALQYRRRFKGLPGEFTRAMKCSQNSPDSQIAAEAAMLSAQYEAELKIRSASTPDALDDQEIETAALAILRKIELTAGDLYPPRTEAIKYDSGSREEPVDEFLADELVGIDSLIDETRQGGIERELTVEEELRFKAMLRAKEALLKPRKRPPRYLSQCFDWYCENRGGGKPDWSKEGRNYIRMKGRFSKILSYIGDRPTEDPDVDRHITEGLELYADAMTEESDMVGQSIERSWKETVAAFRRVSKVFKLRWLIEVPEVKIIPAEERIVFTQEEQAAIVQWCLKQDDHLAAIVLAQLHSGMMFTELARMLDDYDKNVVLEGSIPYLLVKEDTKKEDRKRIIPIVMGLELLQRNLKQGLIWLNETTDSNHSHTIQNRLRRVTNNPDATAHCLRHTWNTMASAADIDLIHRALIGGWKAVGKSEKFSRRMLTYGQSGLQSSEILKALKKSQRKVFKHLLHLEMKTSTNVVQLMR